MKARAILVVLLLFASCGASAEEWVSFHTEGRETQSLDYSRIRQIYPDEPYFSVFVRATFQPPTPIAYKVTWLVVNCKAVDARVLNRTTYKPNGEVELDETLYTFSNHGAIDLKSDGGIGSTPSLRALCKSFDRAEKAGRVEKAERPQETNKKGLAFFDPNYDLVFDWLEYGTFVVEGESWDRETRSIDVSRIKRVNATVYDVYVRFVFNRPDANGGTESVTRFVLNCRSFNAVNVAKTVYSPSREVTRVWIAEWSPEQAAGKIEGIYSVPNAHPTIMSLCVAIERVQREGQANKRSTPSSPSAAGSKVSVPLRASGGVYEVMVAINGINDLAFILDSGASDISLTRPVAHKLIAAGALKESDYKGKRRYQLANGTTQDGTTAVLREVRIGTHVVRDVQAVIFFDAGDSPSLLGQSFLSRLKEWSINSATSTLQFIP